MRMLDLFAGIGGFSLAAHWMGWETAAFVEWDSFAQKVLRKNFSNVPIHGDIKQFDGTQYKGTVDIICGGFPCQPFSSAGKRKGTNDDRYLWPEMLRVIKEVGPNWIVGENVAGLLSMDGGGVLRQIRTDLENAGYWSEVFGIPAIGVGACHQRQRIWIVGYTESVRRKLGASTDERAASRKEHTFSDSIALHSSDASIEYDGRHTREPERRQEQEFRECSFHGITPYSEHIQRDRGMDGKPRGAQPSDENTNFEHAKSFGWHERKGWPEWLHKDAREGYREQWGTHWHEVATRLCRMDDGVPAWVDAHRTRRLKALGNAIVPQVAYEIFRAIQTTNQ